MKDFEGTTYANPDMVQDTPCLEELLVNMRILKRELRSEALILEGSTILDDKVRINGEVVPGARKTWNGIEFTEWSPLARLSGLL